MDIDPYLSNWILEYILKLPLEDRTLDSLISILPFPINNFNLQKKLLLRKLESKISRSSISESVLDLFDLLEEVEFRLGHDTVSDAMKLAYCAVAVKCTLKHLECGDDSEDSSKFKFFEAVKEVWRGRIGRMEKVLGKGGLISEELLVWRDEMETAVWDDSVCENLVKKSESVNAVEAINRYLLEEKEKIGPSFLEVVAEKMKDDKVMQEVLGVGNAGPGPVSEKGTMSSSPDPDRDTGRKADREANRKKVLANKFVGFKRSRRHEYGNSRGAEISDDDDFSPKKNCSSSRSAEVNEVREALKSSSMELKAVVNDPLPDALRLAEDISDMARKAKVDVPGEENQYKNTILIVDSAGIVHAMAGSTAAVQDTNCGDVPMSSVGARNGSAHTFEWDESLDGSPEDLPSRRGSPQLPSPRMVQVSPLNTYRSQTLNGRRRRRRWSVLEEDTLRAGVQEYGRGNWKAILTAYRDIFEDRTDVDLKDKWRNLTRYVS